MNSTLEYIENSSFKELNALKQKTENDIDAWNLLLEEIEFSINELNKRYKLKK